MEHSSEQPAHPPARGWYADRDHDARYWDGEAWTDASTPDATTDAGRQRSLGSLDAGTTVAGMVPIAFLGVIILIVLLLHG